MRFLVLCFFLVCATAMAAQVDNPSDLPSGSIIIDADTSLWSGTGSVLPDWRNAGPIEVRGGRLVVGDSGSIANPSAGMTLHLNTVSLHSTLAKLHIASSQGANRTGTGTTLIIDSLKLDADGDIIVGDSHKDAGGSWQNKISIGELIANAAQGTISIGKDSLFEITKDGGTTITSVDLLGLFSYTVQLGGGTLSVKDGLTLKQANVLGSGTMTDSLTLDSKNSYGDGAPTAKALVNGGETQIYNQDVVIESTGGFVSVRGSAAGAATMRIDGTLVVDGTNTASKAVVGGTATSTGLVQTQSLQLRNNGTIAVEEYGRLDVGSGTAGNTTSIADGTISVDANGAAIFHDAVAVGTGGVLRSSGRMEFHGSYSARDNASLQLDNGIAAFAAGVDLSDQARIELRNNSVLDFSSAPVKLTGGEVLSGVGTNRIATGSNALELAAAGVLHVKGNLMATAGANDSDAGGALTAKSGGSIVLTGGGHIETGVLRADIAANSPTDLFGSSLADGSTVTPSGSVHTGTFIVTDSTSVRGNASIILTMNNGAIAGTYQVMGNGDVVLEKITVNGALVTSGTASLNLGTTGAAALLHVDGGRLDGTDGRLGLANASASALGTLRFTGASQVEGIVDASVTAGGAGFAAFVEGDLAFAGNNTQLDVETYTQTAGRISHSVLPSSAGLRVHDTQAEASVRGAGAVYAANGQFDGGVAFSNGAVLAGAGTTVRSAGAGKNLRVDSTSKINLTTGNLTLTGFDAVMLDGTLVAGYDPVADQATRLHLEDGTSLAMGGTAAIEIGQTLASATYNRGDFSNNGTPENRDWIVTGSVAPCSGFASGTVQVSNVFGDYSFSYAPNATAGQGGGIWLDAYRRANIADADDTRERLTRMWGTDRISHSFAAAISAIAVNMVDSAAHGGFSQSGAYASPDDSAGSINYSILASMATGDSIFNRDKSAGALTGKIDEALLSAYTGHMASGPALAAMETGNTILQQINVKLARDREFARYIEESTGADEALAAAVMQERYANRAWAGGLGLWQNANPRHGQAGYKYTAGGILTGYDRASGRFTLGGSFGYMSGAYQDKAAQAHDSRIESYAFDLYAAYSDPSFWYATIAAGYGLSDNQLREQRGGNWDQADYYTRTWHAGGRVGYDCPVWESLTISPELGLNYFYAKADDHSWLYGGHRLLRYGSMTSDGVQMPLDLSVKYKKIFTPDTSLTFSSSLGYTYTFTDDTLNGVIGIAGLSGVLPVHAAGRKSGHNAYAIGGSLTLVRRTMDMALRYNYHGKPGYHSHQLTGTVGLSF